MAISTNVHSPNQFRFGIAEESTFGTPNTTQGEFYGLHLTEVPQVDLTGGLIVDEVKRADGKQVWSAGERYVSKEGSVYTVQTTGVATRETLGYLIYGVMQDISSETDSGTYDRVYEWDSSTSIPFNPPKHFTCLFDEPESSGTSADREMTSAIIKTLTLSLDPGTHGGRLGFQATWWTGFQLDYGTGANPTPSSWNAVDTTYYTISDLTTKTVDGEDIVLHSFSMTIENNAVRVGHDTSGDAEGYALGKSSPLDVSGSMKVKYDANVEDLYEALVAKGNQSDVQIVLKFSVFGVSDELEIWVNVWLTEVTYDHGNEGGTMLDLSFKACDDGTNEALEIGHKDGVDRGWVA